MKIFRTSIIILCIGFLISSCSNNKSPRTAFFDQEIDYENVKVKFSKTYPDIYQPRKMRVVDDLLLINDFQNAPSIHAFKIKNNVGLEYLKGFGEEGRGPGEFQLPDDFIGTDSLIYVFDGAQMKLVAFTKNLELATNKDIQMRIQGRPITMNSLSEGRFAAGGLFFKDRFQVFNTDGELVGQHGEQINFNEEFTGHNLATSWYSFSVTDPQGEHVYLFAFNADYIEKYSADGKLIKRVQGEEFPVPKMKLEVAEGGRTWPVDNGGKASYLWVDADDDFIYALYIGKPRDKVEQQKTNKVQVFDWDLNLVGAYRLDHEPYIIAADGKGGVYSFLSKDKGTQINYTKLKDSISD